MKKFKILVCAVSFALTSYVFAQSISSVLEMTASSTSATTSSTSTDIKTLAAESQEISNPVQLAMSNPDYVVTPGDIYSLNYAINGGAVSYKIPVDSTYTIRVSNLAVLDVKGKTYLQLKKEVENIVVRNYPMSGVQFILINPATFNVVLTGEVRSTSEVSAWSLSRVSNVIEGHLTPFSSKRFITVKSADGVEKNYDLFKAKRDGDFSQNPYLRPGDTVIVNRLKKVATIKGSVERPGEYELKDDENLKSLIEIYANGFAPFADPTRIELKRVSSDVSKSGQIIYLNKEEYKRNNLDFDVECYDTVTIHSYTILKPVVFLNGAVGLTESSTLMTSNKLSMSFDAGENYAFFIRKNSKLFSSVSDKANAYIIRNGEQIAINLEKILYDASFYSELFVEPNDTLVVPFKQFFVTVAGAVINPGRYPFIPDRDYEYYIGLAGGFDKTKNNGKAVSIIDIYGNELKKNSPILPETTITAKTNSGLYFFNQYAPLVTTFISVIATSVSVMATTGVFK